MRAARLVACAALLAAFGLTLACGGPAPASSANAESGSNTTPSPAATAYLPSSTFQEVMDSVVDPAADYIWESVSYQADLKGTHDRRPRTDAEWHEVRRRAVVLREAANLIAVPGRRVATTNKMVEGGSPLEVDDIQKRLDAKHDALVGFAGGLRGIAQQLVEAADRHDVDAITNLGGTLDEVCEACHRAFWYPNDPLPRSIGLPDVPAAPAKK